MRKESYEAAAKRDKKPIRVRLTGFLNWWINGSGIFKHIIGSVVSYHVVIHDDLILKTPSHTAAVTRYNEYING